MLARRSYTELRVCTCTRSGASNIVEDGSRVTLQVSSSANVRLGRGEAWEAAFTPECISAAISVYRCGTHS